MAMIPWRPEYGDQYKIPSGAVRMTKDLQFHAIDLMQTVCSTSRNYAGLILRRIVAAKQFFESDITYVVRGVRTRLPRCSFAFASCSTLKNFIPQ